MRMRICTHGQQTGSVEINQTVTFLSHFTYKRFMQHLPILLILVSVDIGNFT